MKFEFRDIVWIAVCALIVLYLSKCHRDNIYTKDSRILDLSDQVTKDSLAHRMDTIILNSLLSKAEKQIMVKDSERQQLEGRFVVSTEEIIRLSKAVKQAKNVLVDTSFVTVSPEYVSYCDSLASSGDSIGARFFDYKLSTASLLSAKDTALILKDQLLTKERTFSNECKAQFNALKHYYTIQQAKNKLTNQIFIGAELIGSKQSIIQNVGAVISLKTTSNKLWQVSGGLQSNGQAYGRINGNILISFKH